MKALPSTLSPTGAAELEHSDPDTIIRFAVDSFGSNLAVATQFGPEGTSLFHRVSQVSKNVRFFTIDTGLMFPETLELGRRLETQLGIDIQRVKPLRSIAEQAVEIGPNLWESDPDLCCTLRKVQPMVEMLHGMGAWMTGLRRSQSATRAHTPGGPMGPTFWSRQVRTPSDPEPRGRRKVSGGPRSPDQSLATARLSLCGLSNLHTSRGYREDPRAGRWAGMEKTECGLHTLGSPEQQRPELGEETPCH